MSGQWRRPNAGGVGVLVEPKRLTVDRITYHDPRSGWAVVQCTDEDAGGVTITGALGDRVAGAVLEVSGDWVTDPKYGPQIRVSSYREVLPATADGMRKFLGSGRVKGIGPKTADKIVAHFGTRALQVMENEPWRLAEIQGISEARALKFGEAYEEQKVISELLVFLSSYGVPGALGVRIWKRYGSESFNVVRETPYRLAKEVNGIGFELADRIGQAVGIALDAPERIQAAAVHHLDQQSRSGHTWVHYTALVQGVKALTDQPEEVVVERMDSELLYTEGERVALWRLAAAEQKMAAILRAVLAAPSRIGNRGVLPEPGLELAPLQRSAVMAAFGAKVSVLTGGPGTGKTYALRAILEIAQELGLSVALAAPTGRAALRMQEAARFPALTIHRLLEYSPQVKGFLRGRDNPIEADLVVVDEASMLDVEIGCFLLDAIDPGSHLVLVGDVDQLPSVGPGQVLGDLVESGRVPVTRLSTVFRQRETSYILASADAIRRGLVPTFAKEADDFFLFRAEDDDRIADLVEVIVAEKVGAKFGLAPEEIQVLVPQYRGACGIDVLNQRLQARLNPPAPGKGEVVIGERHFRMGDRVIQMSNDYDTGVMNGEMGVITDVNEDDRTVEVNFGLNRVVPVASDAVRDLRHAYAVTVHKSQGSQFPAVVVVMSQGHRMMLQRNLLYTAITRAENVCIVVGSEAAVARAVRTTDAARRRTGLKGYLGRDPWRTVTRLAA